MEEKLKKEGLEQFYIVCDKYLLKPLLEIVLEYVPYNWQMAEVCRTMQPPTTPLAAGHVYTARLESDWILVKKDGAGVEQERELFIQSKNNTSLNKWRPMFTFSIHYDNNHDIYYKACDAKNEPQRMLVINWETKTTVEVLAPFRFVDIPNWGHTRGKLCIIKASDADDNGLWKIFLFDFLTCKVKGEIRNHVRGTPNWSPYGNLMTADKSIVRQHAGLQRIDGEELGVIKFSGNCTWSRTHSENESVYFDVYPWKAGQKVVTVRITFAWLFGQIRYVWDGTCF
jgi:hypothetical protein